MTSLKLTHFFDAIKQEPDCEDMCNLSSVTYDINDVKQENIFKEELDLAWNEPDDSFETNRENRDFSNDSAYKLGYPIVLLERLPNDVVNKCYSIKRENASEFLKEKKCKKESLLQHYRKFCPDCKKIQSSDTKTTKCHDCGTHWKLECEKCRKQFFSHSGIFQHLKTKCLEKGYYYACFKCDYKSTNRCIIISHLKKVHSVLHSWDRIGKIKSDNVQKDVAIKLYNCSKCGKEFQKLTPLLMHTQMCGQANVDSKSSAATENVAQNIFRPHCVKCDRTVEDEKIGHYHDKKKCESCRSKFSFKCKKCNKIFLSYVGMNHHFKVSHTEKKDAFKCPDCDYKTSLVEYLSKHVKTRHVIETLECPRCSITLKNKERLKGHLKYCKKEPHHQCTICSFKTKHDSSLRHHYKNKHIGGKETCPHCAKVLKKSSMPGHLLRCSGKVADLSCDHCSRLFKNKENLREHIRRLHSVDDNADNAYTVPHFHCNDCTYNSKLKRDLTKHVTTHLDTGKRCPLCKKKYKGEYFKRHTAYCGKEPLRCHLCNYQSITKECLNQHILYMHKKGKKINCPRCDLACKNNLL